MRPRLDILPEHQRALWPDLSYIPKRFVLYGGTAVALRLGHRQSVDFDFFASPALGLELLMASASWLRDSTMIQQEPDTFTCIVERYGLPVKLSFFGSIKTGRVGCPEPTDDGVLLVASAIDLLGHKLKVILQPAEGKDYQEISALLGSGLRVGPESLWGIAEPSQHEPDGREADEGDGVAGQVLEILG